MKELILCVLIMLLIPSHAEETRMIFIGRLEYYYIRSQFDTCYLYALDDQLTPDNPVVCKLEPGSQNQLTRVWFVDETLIRNKVNASYVMAYNEEKNQVVVQVYDRIKFNPNQRLDLFTQFIRLKKDLGKVFNLKTNDPARRLNVTVTTNNIPLPEQAWNFEEAGGSAPDPNIFPYPDPPVVTHIIPHGLGVKSLVANWLIVLGWVVIVGCSF